MPSYDDHVDECLRIGAKPLSQREYAKYLDGGVK